MRSLKLFKLASCRFCNEKISKAKAEYRLAAFKSLLDVLNSLFASTWTSRTVRYIYSVILECCKIIVKRNSDNLCTSVDKASDDAMLYATINNNDLLAVCDSSLASVYILNILS